jgi:hypothetical protein
MNFKGWVPTITGHLSFQNIGGTHYPKSCLGFSESGVCLVSQKRDLLDILMLLPMNSAPFIYLREKVGNHIFKVTGSFEFTLIGKFTAKDDALVGHLYFSPYKDNKAKIKKFRKDVNQIRGDFTDSDISVAKSAIDEFAEHTVTFRLLRNGELSLSGASNGYDPLTEETVANQFYFFMKDIIHVHQHHDPKHDSITSLTRQEYPRSTQWLKETQSSLFRAVIRLKRFKSEKALYQASGLLAYAKAFEISQMDKIKDLRRYNHAEIGDSLRVAKEEIEYKQRKSEGILNLVRTLFIGTIGIVLSSTFLLRFVEPKPTIDLHSSLITATKFVAEKPGLATLTVLIFSICLAFFLKVNDPATFGIFRTTLRMMQSFRMRYFILFNCFLTFLFSGLAYFFLHLVIQSQ